MSKTLVCLTEPLAFQAQNTSKSEIKYGDPSSDDCYTLKSQMGDKLQTYCETENSENSNRGENGSFEGTHCKQKVSRKREAPNVLMECVKRRDNLRFYDFAINVPLQASSQDSPLRTASYSDFSLPCGESNKFTSADLMETSNLDLSDSASGTDSGIETLSKSSSPCHSIDTLSSQDDGGEECVTMTMDIGNDDPLPSLPREISNSVSPSSGQSPPYEDLNGLHLTDEAVLLSSDASAIKSPISKSLFNHVASTLYFSLKDENVAPMPKHILPFMKWKLSTITPILIKEQVLKCGFHLLDANTSEEWLGTWGKHLKCASFKKIRNYQKVNHYPGSFHLGRKDKLWENYKRMQARFGTEDYNFFPETFHLPNDLNSLKSVWGADDEKCWIIKPPASARGTGVKVIYKWSQVPKNKPVIVQRYLSNPYLINGTKFDLRIYVLVPSIEPLRIYVFEDGLVRFASEKYSLSNKSFSNRFVHLTNYSINRKSSSYTANEDENSCQGHKWTLKSFWTYMSNSGIDVEKIQASITDMIIKTIICAEGPICRLMKTYARNSYSCYELFGFDIMLDKNLRPWLLEVNISPSLHTRSLLDSIVKGQMVKDMLNMVGFQVPEKNCASSTAAPPDYGILSTVANRHRSLRNRCLSLTEKNKHSVYTFQYETQDILDNLTPDDVRCLIESEDEFHRRGSFTRVFPSETSSKYFMYFEHIRYYNILLSAWEKNYWDKRKEGVECLQELCNKKFHLQSQIRESKPAVESCTENDPENTKNEIEPSQQSSSPISQ